ncbi:DNA-processing protein DprA [Dactylosporangium sp. NPDC048998]|uniref:DNA-processing protein DprA n=1 Tax=Dactylosporangium sp. NPDC048998 TaxID=3363976 RepID=UPI00371B5C22
MATDRTAYLALASLATPGNRELGNLIRSTGPALALDRLLHGSDLSPELTEAVNARLSAAGRASARVDRIADGMLRRAEQLGARIVTPADEEWPASLHDLTQISSHDDNPIRRDTDPPLCLWLRGPQRLDVTLQRSVSVVGARAATGYGASVASEFAYGLAERGWTVVSGGALGIDVTAHRGALAARGSTVAVLACGIDRAYPAANAAVLEQIGAEGLLVTEWPPGTQPQKAQFLARNRIIAATTRGTVMVEAGSRSGARNTLACARLLQRAAMVVPGPTTSAMSVGCHIELRQPDTVLVTRVEEIIEEIGSVNQPAPTGHRPYEVLDALQARILDAVQPHRATRAEQIAAAAGVSDRDARRTLPLLADLGLVIAGPNGYRRAGEPPAVHRERG